MSDILRSLFAEGGALRVRSILAFIVGGGVRLPGDRGDDTD